MLKSFLPPLFLFFKEKSEKVLIRGEGLQNSVSNIGKAKTVLGLTVMSKVLAPLSSRNV